MKFQEHLPFIFQNLYLWVGYDFCHPSCCGEMNNFSVGPGSFELYSIHIFSAFFLCAEIYATSHIIILVKAFPTRLPYLDIENRTYLYELYEYLSASLPTLKHYTLGKIIHLHMHWKPTFAKWVSFRQTSLASSNESRFVKWVSFHQKSLVLTRFDCWTNESRWKSFIEWLINRDD